MTDRERLLACRTEEEWKWWIEGVMLGQVWTNSYSCLFCQTFRDSRINCNDCQGKKVDKIRRGGFCTRKYKSNYDQYVAAWDRLRRAGIV